MATNHEKREVNHSFSLLIGIHMMQHIFALAIVLQFIFFLFPFLSRITESFRGLFISAAFTKDWQPMCGCGCDE
jgi:Fe2+ transport system protein B